jgi:hypothetical protein
LDRAGQKNFWFHQGRIYSTPFGEINIEVYELLFSEIFGRILLAVFGAPEAIVLVGEGGFAFGGGQDFV